MQCKTKGTSENFITRDLFHFSISKSRDTLLSKSYLRYLPYVSGEEGGGGKAGLLQVQPGCKLLQERPPNIYPCPLSQFVSYANPVFPNVFFLALLSHHLQDTRRFDPDHLIIYFLRKKVSKFFMAHNCRS